MDFGFGLFAKLVKNPTFSQEQLIKEKARVTTSILARNDKIGKIGDKALFEILFAGHPLRFTTLGIAESIKGILRQDVLDFYQTHMGAEHMVITVFGAVDKEETIKVYVTEGVGFFNRYILDSKSRGRLVYVENPEEAKYFISNYRYHPDDYPYENEYFSIEIGGAKIMVVYKL